MIKVRLYTTSGWFIRGLELNTDETPNVIDYYGQLFYQSKGGSCYYQPAIVRLFSQDNGDKEND